MKKFIFMFLVFTQVSFAQENNRFNLGKNEIKFDVVCIVAIPVPTRLEQPLSLI